MTAKNYRQPEVGEELAAVLAVTPSAALLDHAGQVRDWTAAWPFLHELLQRPVEESLPLALAWLGREVGFERGLGADLAGRAATVAGDEETVGRVLAALLAALDGERDPDALVGIASGLGRLADERAVAPLLGLWQHPDAAVRHAVAAGLPGPLAAGELGPDPRGVEALIELSGDGDEDVRDWATFALGSQLEVDTPGVRDALARRVGDAHAETRDEALVGLARRGDQRALGPLAGLLEPDAAEAGPGVSRLQVLAGGELGDPALHDALVALGRWWDVDEPLLTWAVERCDPQVRPLAAAVERELARRVGERLGDVDELAAAGLDLLGVELAGAYPRTALVVRWRSHDAPDEPHADRVPLWGGLYALLDEARADPDLPARLVATTLGLDGGEPFGEPDGAA